MEKLDFWSDDDDIIEQTRDKGLMALVSILNNLLHGENPQLDLSEEGKISMALFFTHLHKLAFVKSFPDEKVNVLEQNVEKQSAMLKGKLEVIQAIKQSAKVSEVINYGNRQNILDGLRGERHKTWNRRLRLRALQWLKTEEKYEDEEFRLRFKLIFLTKEIQRVEENPLDLDFDP